MDGYHLAALFGGIVIGLVAGAAATAYGFVRVFKKHYVIPDDELQAELASIIEERELLRERRLSAKELEAVP